MSNKRAWGGIPPHMAGARQRAVVPRPASTLSDSGDPPSRGTTSGEHLRPGSPRCDHSSTYTTRLTTGGLVTDWIVRRWKRFGHDRLYASTPGGTDLGYLDVASGRFHSDDLSNLPLLRRAIEEHLGTNEAPYSRSSPVARQSASAHESSPPSPSSPQSPTSSAVPECEVSDRESNPRPVSRSTLTAPPPVTPPALPSAEPAVPAGWHDLADVRAGAAARERALAEREAQGLMRHLFARMIDAKTDERA